MNPLQANDLLALRDAGERQDAAERAVTILARAFPDEGAEAMWRLSLGRRNGRLLDVRERLFGRRMEGYAECPHCGEPLELAMDTLALQNAPAETEASELELVTDDYAVRFRLIDSNDVQAAARERTLEAARALLVDRCVLEARHRDHRLAAAELPAPVIEQIAERMELCDPLADTTLALICPFCKNEWEIAFDIASFLDTEIQARARHLLWEVHTLAHAYAWSQEEILALSPRRRRDYLELILQ
jgi:hypothetical protein